MNGVVLERDGAVARIVVDRPHVRNAVDRAAMSALEAIIGELEVDDNVACVVFTGRDGFIAGGDVKDFASIPSADEGRAMSRWMNTTVRRLAQLPCPVIAAINGDAYGGGCELALACDIRVISAHAKMVFRQVAMGLTPGWGGGQRLARIVGRSKAILLLSTAASVDAPYALQLGLVDEVVEDAVSRATEIGGEIARHGKLAVRNTKRAIVRGEDLPLQAAIQLESELFGQAWGSDEHHAAVRRFLDRRNKPAG